MLSSRYFRQLFLPYLLLIAAAVTAIGALASARLRNSYLDATRQRLHDDAVLVSDLVRADLAEGRVTLVRQKASELGTQTGARVTIIAADGTVVADNEADPGRMENHRQPDHPRPEIEQSAVQGDGWEVRTSATLREPLLYWSHRFDVADGKTYFVRLALHLSALDQHLRLLYGGIVTAGVFAFASAALLCFYLARRSAGPMIELTDFANALARGELNRRLLPATAGEVRNVASALNGMADSLGRVLSQTTRDRAELLAMLGSMSEGVIATDTKQRVILVNRRAGEMFHFDPDAVHSKPLWEVIRNEAILKAVGEVLANRERKAFQVSPAVGLYLEVTACTFPTPGPVEGLVLVAHDTTQSVRYQELRKEFVANVSHELRTPLTVIKGFTETLRDGAMKDPVSGPRFLETIERHVDQLTNLVSDLLELSKLEAAPDVPRRSSFDLGAVVRRASDLLLPAAQMKSQRVTLDISRAMPRITGNPDYVERAISNLIDNAIKYTPHEGEIGITAGVEGNYVFAEVTDNGIGIPAQDLSRVFERFYRVDRSRSREMGGTGLGLSIVKHVAQVHGGAIDVVSTPGAGSRFRLRLPVSQDVSVG